MTLERVLNVVNAVWALREESHDCSRERQCQDPMCHRTHQSPLPSARAEALPFELPSWLLLPAAAEAKLDANEEGIYNRSVLIETRKGSCVDFLKDGL